jgi:hypothetical protein
MFSEISPLSRCQTENIGEFSKIITTKVHKQANQNIFIDEVAMEFSQSVLSVYLSQPSENPDLVHNVSWRENENQEATDIDDNSENEETDGNHGDTKDNTETEDSQSSEQIATIITPNLEASSNEAFTMEDNNDKQEEEDQSDTEEDNSECYVTIIDGVQYLQYRTLANITKLELTPEDDNSSNLHSPSGTAGEQQRST